MLGHDKVVQKILLTGKDIKKYINDWVKIFEFLKMDPTQNYRQQIHCFKKKKFKIFPKKYFWIN